MINSPLLMAPGPVQIHPEILKILAQPAMHHRTRDFEKILSRVLDRLPALFQTKSNVLMQSSTGSGGMESTVVNFFSKGDKVL